MSNIRTGTISGVNGTDPVTLTKQSAAKSWYSYNADNTPVLRDSFNVTSITDDAYGRQTVNLTSSMSNSNYGVTSCGGGGIRNNTLANISVPNAGFASGSFLVDCQYAHVTAFDPPRVTVVTHGDLA